MHVDPCSPRRIPAPDDEVDVLCRDPPRYFRGTVVRRDPHNPYKYLIHYYDGAVGFFYLNLHHWHYAADSDQEPPAMSCDHPVREAQEDKIESNQEDSHRNAADGNVQGNVAASDENKHPFGSKKEDGDNPASNPALNDHHAQMPPYERRREGERSNPHGSKGKQDHERIPSRHFASCNEPSKQVLNIPKRVSLPCADWDHPENNPAPVQKPGSSRTMNWEPRVEHTQGTAWSLPIS